MDAHDPLYPAVAQFPLGRRFGDDGPFPRVGGGHLVPFGASLAVVPLQIQVDLSQVGYDQDRQIGVVEQDGVLVPLAKHSTGQTRTNTAVRDKAPADADTGHTED